MESDIICPYCNSTQLRRSHAKNILERTAKRFGKKCYRCRICGWRGLLDKSGRSSLAILSISPSNVIKKKELTTVFLILLALLSSFFLLTFCTNLMP